MEDLRWLDFVIVFVYFVLVAWIGFRFSRRQNSTEAYFAARRSIPHWAMGVSMFATLISSITFIAYPGSAYAGTWSELYPMFMILIVLLLVGTVIVPFFRQAVGLSAYEYFGQRFGYRHARIEAGEWILKHDLHVLAQASCVAVFEAL